MSQIRDITIEGFRSIKSIKELKLRPLNILIGANGSGKSNFLGAIELLRTAVLSRTFLFDTVARMGGGSRLLFFGPARTPKMRFRVGFTDNSSDFEAEMRHGDNDMLYPRFSIEDIDVSAEHSGILDAKPGTVPALELLGNKVDRWKRYYFHDTTSTSPMKSIVRVHDNRGLNVGGSNLAAFLYLLRKKHADNYTRIREIVQFVAPFFADFALQPLAQNEELIQLEWRHVGSEEYFNAGSLSDGTLRFIALTTLLLQPESLRPSVILLDEPELGLHPYAIHLLAAMLEQSSADSQIIVATQSPILLDYFKPEDVLVAERTNGATEFLRLDSKRLAEWLEEYSLGQLWEKNEFGGRPSPESFEEKSEQ